VEGLAVQGYNGVRIAECSDFVPSCTQGINSKKKAFMDASSKGRLLLLILRRLCFGKISVCMQLVQNQNKLKKLAETPANGTFGASFISPDI
jgi:hypothetical protein